MLQADVQSFRAVGPHEKRLGTAATAPLQQTGQRKWRRTDSEGCALWLLSGALGALYTTQNVLSPNLSEMAKELNFSPWDRDRYLGAGLALALGVVPLPAAAAVGVLADTYKRNILLSWCLAAGSIASLATAMSSSYTVLFALRAVAGTATGGALPVAFSAMADVSSAAQRNSRSTALTAAMGVGILLGQVVAGLVGPSLGWRIPVALCALPGLLLAPAVRLLLREPPREKREASCDLKDSQPAAFGQLHSPARGGFCACPASTTGSRKRGSGLLAALRVPTNVLLALQGLPGSIPLGVMFVFLSDFLAQEKGLPVRSATLLVITFGLGAAAGGVGGGVAGHLTYRHGFRSLLPLLCGFATAAAALPMLAVLQADHATAPPLLVHGCAFAAGALSCVNTANVRTMLLNCNGPSSRGSAIALATLLAGLGRGIGPLAAGWLADSDARESGSLVLVGGAGGGEGPRALALRRSVSFFAVGGLILALAAFSIRQDEAAAVQESTRRRSSSASKAMAKRSPKDVEAAPLSTPPLSVIPPPLDIFLLDDAGAAPPAEGCCRAAASGAAAASAADGGVVYPLPSPLTPPRLRRRPPPPADSSRWPSIRTLQACGTDGVGSSVNGSDEEVSYKATPAYALSAGAVSTPVGPFMEAMWPHVV